MSSSQPNPGPANAGPSTPAAQSPQDTGGAQTQPPPPASSAADPVADCGQNAGTNVPTSVPQKVQAAQLSDKSPTIDALAGGTKSPSPPVDGPSQPLQPSTPAAQKRPRKKKSNQFDFRADEDTADRIYDRVELAKCTPSEAIRQLIEDGATLCARVILSPRTPPQQLEVFIGQLKAWRYAFQEVRSRLNAPMPQHLEDQKLVEQVHKWRATAEELHEKIKELLDAAQATLRLLTRLTPDRVKLLRSKYPNFVRWAKERAENAEKADKPADKKSHASMSEAYLTIAELIEDMGLVEKAK